MAENAKPGKEARKPGKEKAKKPPPDRSESPILPVFAPSIINNLSGTEYVICKHCKQNVLKSAAPEHIAGCLKAKQEQARKKKEAREAAAARKNKQEKGDGSDDDVSDSNKPLNTTSATAKGARKSTNKTAPVGDDSKKSKKRKADTDDYKTPENKKKKTKKEEAKAKQVPKTKGPVDVEKQCGVQLANGAKCARSLTCKSHSMGAKRSVPGRSLPYDMLLAAYQKKNQARQQSMSPFQLARNIALFLPLSLNRLQKPLSPPTHPRSTTRTPTTPPTSPVPSTQTPSVTPS